MEEIQIEKLKITEVISTKVTPTQPIFSPSRPPKHKRGERFLKGPIPWTWLATAARQPGKSLHLAIAIWFMAGLTRSKDVKISNLLLRALGVKRSSRQRSLAALEQAGLIAIQHSTGKSPIITILDSSH
jgi:hypothetical protein